LQTNFGSFNCLHTTGYYFFRQGVIAEKIGIMSGIENLLFSQHHSCKSNESDFTICQFKVVKSALLMYPVQQVKTHYVYNN
jgi:hypothetical protein